jgi:uncharacterized protein (TIGR02284 family)
MAIDNDYVIRTLNRLIETCRDSQEGFRMAAERMENAELKTLFNLYGQQRAQFAAELQAEVRRLGGDPEEAGSLAGALHHGWINIKSMVTGADEAAIISECERGEDLAVKNYQEALRGELPNVIRELVEGQVRQVKEAHRRIRGLERASSAGA